MMNKLILCGLLFGFLVTGTGCGIGKHQAPLATGPIKVACIGDSITYGAGVTNQMTQSYPALLQEFLGSGYLVRNYGVSGTTMLKNGDNPYWDQSYFRTSANWAPAIVVIQLGTNDSKAWNWNSYGSKFLSDYKDMIDHYRQLSSHPKIYVSLPPHIYTNPGYGIDGNVLESQIIPLIRQAANESDPAVPIIDVNSATFNMPDYYPDSVHPNERGSLVIAEVVANAIGPAKTPPTGLLDRTGWTATAFATNNSSEVPANALDQYRSTRWSSGVTQTNGSWFEVDMQSTQDFNKIVLDASYSGNEYPSGYQVYVSDNGSSWGSPIASGTGTAAQTTITFPLVTARYIKIVLTASSSFWWSIHDLEVFKQ
jgi:lysophospholipase L1-like esterase